MELSEVAAELYAAPLEDFLDLRKAQVSAAKAAGNKELAKQIGQLRKPTRSAWLVNLLARQAPAELEGLLEIGAALRAAQQQLDGAELRRLSGERHRAVDALTKRAAELGSAADYAATDAVRQEVSQTLQVALADPEQADVVSRGILSSAASYGGFGPFELSAALPATAAPKRREPESASEEEKADETEDQAGERATREAREDWERARTELAEAQAEADLGRPGRPMRWPTRSTNCAPSSPRPRRPRPRPDGPPVRRGNGSRSSPPANAPRGRRRSRSGWTPPADSRSGSGLRLCRCVRSASRRNCCWSTPRPARRPRWRAPC